LISDFNKEALLLSFGVTRDQFDAMVDTQGGGCAICGAEKDSGGKRRLNIDHCHKDGHVRGVLCISCNTKLGWFEKWSEKVLKYLSK
jgi:hypothetical protein